MQALLVPSVGLWQVPALAATGEASEACTDETPNKQNDPEKEADKGEEADPEGSNEGPGNPANTGDPESEETAQSENTVGPEGGDHGDGGRASGDASGTDADGSDTSPSSSSFGQEDDYGNNLDGGSSEGFSSTHDPIDVRLADKVHVQVDYLGSGAAPLRLARNYHSNLSAFPAQVTIGMGTGWRSYYDRSVQVLSATQVRLHRANGRTLDFNLSGGVWSSVMPGGTLNVISGGWQYVNHRDGIELYNSAGRLLSMASAGLVTTLQYDASNRLVRVANPFGRALNLAYDAASRVAVVTLPGGGTLGYSYSSLNNLVSIRFADNTSRQYAYENVSYPNALTGVIDESGKRRLTWGYDSAGRPNMGYYGAGLNRVDIVYNGDTVTTADARGTQRTRQFTTAGQRRVLASLQTTATTDSPATSWSFAYAANGHLNQMVSRSGEVRSFAPDGRGRAISATRAAGTAAALTAQATWHPIFRKRTQTVALGVTRNTTLDAHGRVTAITSTGADGSTITELSKVYNAQGLLQSFTDARGATTSYSYDSLGNRISAVNALGQTTTYGGHDAHGRATSIVRSDGTQISRSFDARGRLAARTMAGATTSFSYDNANRLLRVTRPDGGWRQRSYDGAGFHTGISNHRGETTAISRDSSGQEIARTTRTAAGAVAMLSSREFNGHGRVKASIDSRNQRTQWLYRADGRPSGVSNPLGQVQSVALDLLDRPTTLTQPNTTAMRLAGGPATVSSSRSYHTARANHIATTDTVAVATGYAHDGFNRRVADAGNDAGSKAWVRNAAGDVTSITDALGATTSLSRDALGRVTSATPASGGAINITYVSGRSDALPATVSDASGSTSWTYDSVGRVLSKSQTVAGITRTVTLTRDSLGRVISMVYPSGLTVNTTYSGDRVSSIVAGGYTLISNISYRPFSNVATGWTWGNGSTYSRSFDGDGRVTQVSLGTVQRSYGYDAVGRITTQTDTKPGSVATSTISYDEAGALISFNGPAGNFIYAYDSNGNRRSYVSGGTTYTNTYAAGSNRILTSPNGLYNYRADGNPSGDGYYLLGYNAFGSMTALTAPNEYKVARGFNAQGMRVSSVASYYQSSGIPQAAPVLGEASLSTGTNTSTDTKTKPGAKGSTPIKAPTHVAASALLAGSASTTLLAGGSAGTTAGTWFVQGSRQFLHDDGGNLLGEYRVSGTSKNQETVWFNGQPVGALIDGVGYLVHADHLATPRALTRISDGIEAWRWDSDPFGLTYPTSSIGLTYNLRFPGQQFDADTGYHYNWMRDYNPWTGRYLQADPIGLAGGMSRYEYVGGNPLSNIDPTGTNWLALGGIVFGAYGIYQFWNAVSTASDAAIAVQAANQNIQVQISNMQSGRPFDPSVLPAAQAANQTLINSATNIATNSPPGTSLNPSLGLVNNVKTLMCPRN